jgi:DNA polymerase III delta prime subunit
MLELKTSHSYLFNISEVPEEVFREFNPIDRLQAEGGDLSIKELRILLNLASQSPLGERRLLIINSADRLAPILQNTLLKVLEEPYPHLTIILQTTLPKRLLPTVRSRLTLISSDKTEVTTSANYIPTSLNLTNIKNRDSLYAELNTVKSQLSGTNKNYPNRYAYLELIDQAIRRLDSNCNYKLVIDSLLLHWEERSGKQIPGDKY